MHKHPYRVAVTMRLDPDVVHLEWVILAVWHDHQSLGMGRQSPVVTPHEPEHDNFCVALEPILARVVGHGDRHIALYLVHVPL